jgi:hypothetical protein
MQLLRQTLLCHLPPSLCIRGFFQQNVVAARLELILGIVKPFLKSKLCALRLLSGVLLCRATARLSFLGHFRGWLTTWAYFDQDRLYRVDDFYDKILGFPLTAVGALNYVKYVCFICLFTDRYGRDIAQWYQPAGELVSASMGIFASGIPGLLL